MTFVANHKTDNKITLNGNKNHLLFTSKNKEIIGPMATAVLGNTFSVGMKKIDKIENVRSSVMHAVYIVLVIADLEVSVIQSP